MARWIFEIPLTSDGQRIGCQLFHYPTTAYDLARARVLADVQSPTAIRHRRGADVDLSRLKARQATHFQL